MVKYKKNAKQLQLLKTRNEIKLAENCATLNNEPSVRVDNVFFETNVTSELQNDVYCPCRK